MSDKRRNSPHLNQKRLEQLALAYVARFATTQAKLRLYLQRKLQERGWEEDEPPELDGLITRYATQGWVDDASWARMKAGSLLGRGYGARRVGEVLGQAGVAEDLRSAVRPKAAEQRRSAILLARRRRFGPFSVSDRVAADDVAGRAKLREKQIAAMLRAGHPLDIARRIVESEDADALEKWCDSEFGDE